MTKCRLCGEANPDTNRFCSNCGARLEEKDNSALTEALENAEKEFDKDSMVSLDKSRITYVCTVCGSVNRIDQEKCSRCGKPRPRSEYVNALRRIKQGNSMRDEQALVAPAVIQAPSPAPVVEPEPVREQQPAVRQEVVQAVAPANGQAAAIQQPFVIVPYVNPMQPLWQYNPDQLYRYEPYTPEELEARRAEREMAELSRRAAEAASTEAAPEPEYVPSVPAAKRSGRFTAIAVITLILTIIAGAIAYLGSIVEFLSAFGGEAFYEIALDIASAEGIEMMAPICALIFLVIAVVLLIRSVVRLIRKRASTRGWFIPLVWFISFVAFAAGCVIAEGRVEAKSFTDVLPEIGVGAWILGAISLVTLIISFFSVKTAKTEQDIAA